MGQDMGNCIGAPAGAKRLAPVAMAIGELLAPGRPVLARTVAGQVLPANVASGYRYPCGRRGVLVTLASGAELTLPLSDVFTDCRGAA